jgi:hypothetical protein
MQSILTLPLFRFFQMANLCWWYYLSKFTEFLDTVSTDTLTYRTALNTTIKFTLYSYPYTQCQQLL